MSQICQNEGCAAVFEPSPYQIEHPGATQQRYCTKTCRLKARQTRTTARLGPCRACGSTDRVHTNLGLIMCSACAAVFFLSCRRKIQHPTAEAAQRPVAGEALLSYQCEMCGHFHATNSTGVPDGWHERVASIALYLRSVGFDANAARGWSNVKPDRTKECVDA